ncbi:MAG: hypothetical protein ACLUVM_11445 [Blautia faecis]
MARRYRYSFTKKKEAKKGKLSAGLAAASFLLFITAVVLAYLLDDSFGFLVGGVGLFATLLSVYGFIMGLLSFSEEGRSHKTSIIGSISNGLFLIVWIGSVPDRIVEHGVCIVEIRLKAIIIDQTGEGEYIWMNV